MAHRSRQKYAVINDREGLDKLIRRLFEVDRWSYLANDSNSNEKASCFNKNAPNGIGIGLGTAKPFTSISRILTAALTLLRVR